MGEKQISAIEIRLMTKSERLDLLHQLKQDRLIARGMNKRGSPPTTMRRIKGTYRRLITIMRELGEIK